MFADNSTGPAELQIDDTQKQWAIVMEDVQSLPSGGASRKMSTDLMQLYEGDKVEVLGPMHSLQGQLIVECRFEGLAGLFPLQALKLIKNKREVKRTPDSGERAGQPGEVRPQLKQAERRMQRAL